LGTEFRRTGGVRRDGRRRALRGARPRRLRGVEGARAGPSRGASTKGTRRPRRVPRAVRGEPMNSSRLEGGGRHAMRGGAPPVLRGGHRPPPRALVGERRVGRGGSSGAQADMPSAETSGAICVQTFDDSRNSAIHTTYRISLRSSSLREPRYPLLRVVSSLSKNRAGEATVFIRSENEGL